MVRGVGSGNGIEPETETAAVMKRGGRMRAASQSDIAVMKECSCATRLAGGRIGSKDERSLTFRGGIEESIAHTSYEVGRVEERMGRIALMTRVVARRRSTQTSHEPPIRRRCVRLFSIDTRSSIP
jgi:hypothetical protein